MKIKIRSTNKGHCVDFHPSDGKRTRRFFSTKSDAEAFARDLQNQQRRGGELWLAATGSERSELITILEFCRTNTIRPLAVLEGYRGSSPALARSTPSIPLADACQAFLDAKRVAGASAVYIEKFRSFLNGFQKGRTELPLTSITSETLNDYLAPRTLSPVSRNSYLKRFNAFLQWHCKQGNLQVNPTAKLDKAKVVYGTPFTLNVTQAETILRHTQANAPAALATLTLLLFAGIRPAESARIMPEMFRLDASSLHLPGNVTKTGRARIVPLQPSAIAWFRACPSLQPLDNAARQKFMQALARHLGFARWPQDCLRHTAASFLLSLLRSADAVSLLLGNGTDILQRHYIDAVTPADCAAFWSIMPA